MASHVNSVTDFINKLFLIFIYHTYAYILIIQKYSPAQSTEKSSFFTTVCAKKYEQCVVGYDGHYRTVLHLVFASRLISILQCIF
jgi:hypothetical protein